MMVRVVKMLIIGCGVCKLFSNAISTATIFSMVATLLSLDMNSFALCTSANFLLELASSSKYSDFSRIILFIV